MLKLVQELTKPKREVFKVKILNIFAPNICIATFDDARKQMPSTEEYLEMEHGISRAWNHAPAYNFESSPEVGMFVMVMEEKKRSNFKRGAIINVDQIGSTKYYDVFLYDWSLVKRFTIRSLARLPDKDSKKLPARTFFFVLAGMMDATNNGGHGGTEAWASLLTKAEDGKSGPNRGTKRARRWFHKRSRTYVDIFKSFQDVIFTGDIKGIRSNTDAGECVRECFASSMKKHGYLIVDRAMRRKDKDPQLNNWYEVSVRLNKIIPCFLPAFEDIDDEKDNIFLGRRY